MLPFAPILFNIGLFTLAFASIIWWSLWWNPRVWMKDYPQAMQAALPPLTPYEQNQQKLLGVLLLAVMLGVPLLLNWQLRATLGAAFSLPIAYFHTWLMLQAANLYDAIGIDLLISFKPPKFAVPAGAEPYLHLLWDKNLHLRNFIKGAVGMSVLALPIALISML
jgi:hypothetical protein